MSNFKVGYSIVNANPPLGAAISGYYVKRHAKGFLDDITVSTIALNLGDKNIAIISIDNCYLYASIINKMAELIQEKTCIKKENVFISVTHTHTGPGPSLDYDDADDKKIAEEYIQFLINRTTDSVTLAFNDLKDAKMGYIYGYAPERIAYIRRYMMKDGTTFTCPPIDDPNIDYPLGTLDQRINVLRFDRVDAPSIVLVNYGIHADTVNGEMICSDFIGVLRSTLDKALDGVKTIFICGAQGDVGSTNVHPTKGDMNDTEISFDNEMKSPGMARFVGRAIAGTVLQVYDKVHYVDVEDIDVVIKEFNIPSNMPTKEEMPLAKLYNKLHNEGRDDEIPFKAMQLTTVVAEAQRMCNLEHGPEFYTMKLTGIKLGPVALVGIPGEPFTEIGVKIKQADGWNLILPCGLTNGYMGYFPTKSAYDEGGYESRSSKFKCGCAELIVEKSIELLNEMKK